jgi:hypothetical protein
VAPVAVFWNFGFGVSLAIGRWDLELRLPRDCSIRKSGDVISQLIISRIAAAAPSLDFLRGLRIKNGVEILWIDRSFGICRQFFLLVSFC